MGRGTLPLAAAVAVELAETGKAVLAAGGIVNGKGLLAALALGCDGVVMGTRYGTLYAVGSLLYDGRPHERECAWLVQGLL